MQLIVTNAGSIVETNALDNGVFPAVESVLVGDGTPHTNPAEAIALVHHVLALNVTFVERVSPQTVRFHAEVPMDTEINIRELGLKLADGTLYAYAPYISTLASYFHKPAGFVFAFSVTISRVALPPITVNYMPFDTGVISDAITAQTLGQITDYGARLAASEANVTAVISSQAALSMGMSALQGFVDDSNGEVTQVTSDLSNRVSAIEALVYAGL